jgi:hypothetical protein
VSATLEHAVQLDEVAGEQLHRIGETVVQRGIGSMPLIPRCHEIHHHQSALSDGEVEPGRLADHRCIDFAGLLDRGAHSCVLRLLLESQDDQEPPGIHSSTVHDVLDGVQHCCH